MSLFSWRCSWLSDSLEPEAEGRAFAHRAFNLDGGLVLLQELARDRQTQAGSLRFVSKKWIEDLIDVLRGNAHPRVRYLQIHALLLGITACGDREIPAVGHGLHGVDHQVDQNLGDLGGIDE